MAFKTSTAAAIVAYASATKALDTAMRSLSPSDIEQAYNNAGYFGMTPLHAKFTECKDSTYIYSCKWPADGDGDVNDTAAFVRYNNGTLEAEV